MDWRGMADSLNKSVLRTFKESAPVTYIPAATGTPFGVTLFFESSGFQVNMETEMTRYVYRPRVFVLLEDLGRLPAEDDKIVFRGAEFRVVEEESDGYGGVYLNLQRLG